MGSLAAQLEALGVKRLTLHFEALVGAVFWLDSTFSVTRRGLVLAGQIVDGRLRVGDVVVIPVGMGHRRERITGVEMGHGQYPNGARFGFVGLLLGDLPAGEIPAIRGTLSQGHLLTVESAT